MKNQKILTHLAMEGVCNARHLGGFRTVGDGVTRPYAFIRCESPADMTDTDIALLLKLGVRTVIDLRNHSEAAREPNPFASVPTIDRYNIPVFPSDTALHAFDVMDRGESYCWMLDRCGAAFLQVFETILDASRGVLFHCAAGKDRTGVLAALLLLLAGVDREDVIEEYYYTQTLLAPWVKRKNALTPHVPEEELLRLHSVQPSYMRKALDHLERRYGSVCGYLSILGLNDVEISLLRSRMVQPVKNRQHSLVSA